MSIDTSLNTLGLERSPTASQPASDLSVQMAEQAGRIERRAVEASVASGAARSTSPDAEAQAVQEAAEQIDQFLRSINSDLNISVDRDVNRTVVKVINRTNDEVIRQIPSEEVLALMRRMGEIAQQAAPGVNPTGVLLSDQA